MKKTPAPSSKKKPTRKKKAAADSDWKLRIPEVEGKAIDYVEVRAESDYPCVIISFQDKTCLIIDTVPCLTMEADYMDNSGEEDRRIKKWPALHN
jgi:hypothetical protein